MVWDENRNNRFYYILVVRNIFGSFEIEGK